MDRRPIDAWYLMILLILAGNSSSVAVTLLIEKTGAATFNLLTPQNSAIYYFLEDSMDMETFDPFSMALGDTASVWQLTVTAELPARFFRATGISVFAPNDMDGDGIDDIYELRHPHLDPLNPHDAQMLDPEGDGLTYLVSEKNRHSRKMQLPIVYLIYYQITLLNLSPIFF